MTIRPKMPVTACVLMLATLALPGCALLGAAAGVAASAATKAVDVLVEAPAETPRGEEVTVASAPDTTG